MKDRLDKLAFSFFKLFAQYECSLKVMRFANMRDKNLELQWDRFANEIGRCVMENPTEEVAAALEYLLNQPPKRQVLVGDRIDWAEVPTADKSPQALFSHIRRVRNNLYHGGKFNNHWFEPDRSEVLMKHCTTVLEALIGKDATLRETIRATQA